MQGQHGGVLPDAGVETVDLLLEVGQAVVIRVRLQRVRGNPGAELRAVGGKGVDDLPAVCLLPVGQAVAVAIHAVGVGPQAELVCVGEAVAVGVVEGRVAAVLELKVVGEAIAVGVPLAIVGVGAAVHVVEKAVAVKVLLAGEGQPPLGPPQRWGGGLPPGQAVAAILAKGLVELIQGGREDVKGEGLPQV